MTPTEPYVCIVPTIYIKLPKTAHKPQVRSKHREDDDGIAGVLVQVLVYWAEKMKETMAGM